MYGHFKMSSNIWSVAEKEGFGNEDGRGRLDHNIMGKEVKIFKYHSNLSYMYDPYRKNSNIPSHTARNSIR